MYVCLEKRPWPTVRDYESNGGLLLSATRIDRRALRSGLVIATLLALLTGAHDAAAATSVCEARATRAHQILMAESIDNWEALDDRTVLIWTRHSARAHLLRLDRALTGLTDAAILYLVDPEGDGRITPCGRDGIAIGDDDYVTQVAGIVSIELLSAKRTAELDPSAHTTQRDSVCI